MPSFRTIAYLKKNNAEAFRKVFRQFVLMLKDMGLIEGETIGIDSFKIFAQNSLRNNYTQKKKKKNFLNLRLNYNKTGVRNTKLLIRN